MIDRKRLLGLDGEDHVMALRILEYLARHPHATDTIEGISRCWLEGDFAADEVEDVVLELVGRRFVQQTLKPDGEWIYSYPRDRSPQTAQEAVGAS